MYFSLDEILTRVYYSLQVRRFNPDRERGPCMTFQVGEKVVYPNHGVGTIENISSRAFGTQSERFYLLRLSPNRMTVMLSLIHISQKLLLQRRLRGVFSRSVVGLQGCGHGQSTFGQSFRDYANRFGFGD